MQDIRETSMATTPRIPSRKSPSCVCSACKAVFKHSRAFTEHNCPALVQPLPGEAFAAYMTRAEAHSAAWRKENGK